MRGLHLPYKINGPILVAPATAHTQGMPTNRLPLIGHPKQTAFSETSNANPLHTCLLLSFRVLARISSAPSPKSDRRGVNRAKNSPILSSSPL